MSDPAGPGRGSGPIDLGSLDPERLSLLNEWTMPFGRYAGRRLIDLPEPYVVWFHQNGVPDGKLGELLELLYEIKLNGLEPLIRQIPPHR